jgi:hypothetical protein
MAHVGDAVHCYRVGRDVFLDPHPATPQVAESLVNVRHPPHHLCLRVRRADCAAAHDELRSTAAAEDHPLLVLANKLQSEGPLVEAAAGFHLGRQQNRKHGMIAKHAQVLDVMPVQNPMLRLLLGGDSCPIPFRPALFAALSSSSSAAAAAWTADRMLRRGASPLPDPPSADENGRFVAIWY